MNKSLRRAGISMYLAAFAGVTALTGCVQEPSPFDPRTLQQLERSQDTQVKRQPMYPLPTTQDSQFVPGETRTRAKPPGETSDVPEGPIVQMSLQEMVHRAILNSYDIRVAGFDTAVDQTRVMEADARFDPSFFTNLNFERVDKEAPGTFTNFDPVFNSLQHLAFFNQSDTTTFQTGFQQDMPAGGQVKLQYQVVNTWTSPQQQQLATFYENELVLTVTQPLLQNFGVAVNRARITISQNNQRVSLLDFRKTVEDTVLQIEKTYLQLMQQESDVATLERVVKASETTANVLFHRQQADVTAVQIQQANAATETRRAALVRARAQLATLSDQLKRLMNDPDFPVAGSVILSPAADEIDTPIQFDLDDAIETGLENRLELGQQQVRIDSAEVAMHVAKNNLLPQLNFQGSVTSDGVAHFLDQTFSNQNDFNHIGWAAGLQFQFPLGNRAAGAIWQRALLQRQQAIYSYGTLVDQVALDVKSAARDVHTSWEELKADRQARFANEKTLEGLQKQQDAAVELTPEFVKLKLDTQDQLAQSEEAEHQAIYNYNFAIATLEKSKGTILRYNNVILEQQQLPFDMMSKSQSTRRFVAEK
jgi:outer membrane protein